MQTKTRKQGNSIMVTVPNDFNIPAGVVLEPKLVEQGIMYEFVEPQDDFFDFSSDILRDLIAEGVQGEELLTEFNRRKQDIADSFRKLALEPDGKKISKEQMEAELDL